MTVDFRSSSRPPSSSERWIHLAMAVLQLVLVGMLLYLRFGPFARFLASLEARGTEVPAWLPLLFSGGVAVLSFFLGVRAVLSLRRFREGG
jgi:hypothetical protein